MYLCINKWRLYANLFITVKCSLSLNKCLFCVLHTLHAIFGWLCQQCIQEGGQTDAHSFNILSARMLNFIHSSWSWFIYLVHLHDVCYISRFSRLKQQVTCKMFYPCVRSKNIKVQQWGSIFVSWYTCCTDWWLNYMTWSGVSCRSNRKLPVI